MLAQLVHPAGLARLLAASRHDNGVAPRNGAFRVTIRKSVCDPAGVQRPKRRDRLAMPRSGCPENVRMAGCKPHRIRRLTR
jgi:hypothetical protein